jgi:peptide chain release factor 3
MTGAGNGARSGALTSPTSAADKADLGKFLDAYPSSLSSDLDGGPVFMASSAFNLRYEQEHWPKIAFADVKDYQKAAA